MAADNDDAYNLTPASILKTVEVAREFVEKNLSNVTKVRGEWGLHAKIASFLAWPQERVSQALAQLHAFEDKEVPLSRKAVETLPTIHAATVLRQYLFFHRIFERLRPGLAAFDVPHSDDCPQIYVHRKFAVYGLLGIRLSNCFFRVDEQDAEIGRVLA